LAISSRLEGAELRTAELLFEFGVDPEQARFESDLIVFFDKDLGCHVSANNRGGLTLSTYRSFVISKQSSTHALRKPVAS